MNLITKGTAIVGALFVGGTEIKVKTGASTGTAAEQTIAHGLGEAPNFACIYIPTTGEIRGVVSDATNIMATVDLAVEYGWMVMK